MMVGSGHRACWMVERLAPCPVTSTPSGRGRSGPELIHACSQHILIEGSPPGWGESCNPNR